MKEKTQKIEIEKKYKPISRDLVADVASEVLTKLDYNEFKEIIHRYNISFVDIVKSMFPGLNKDELEKKVMTFYNRIHLAKHKYGPKVWFEKVNDNEHIKHIEPYNHKKHKRSRVSADIVEHFIKCISEDVEIRNLYQMMIEEHEDKIKITNIYDEEK